MWQPVLGHQGPDGAGITEGGGRAAGWGSCTSSGRLKSPLPYVFNNTHLEKLPCPALPWVGHITLVLAGQSFLSHTGSSKQTGRETEHHGER